MTAFPGYEPHEIEQALVTAFSDRRIRTRASCLEAYLNRHINDLTPTRWNGVRQENIDWSKSNFWKSAPRFSTHYFESVTVSRHDLERWIASAETTEGPAPKEPGTAPAPTIGAETRCRGWLKGEVENWRRSGGPPPRRDQMLKVALEKFPDLSQRGFLQRVWTAEAPEEWRRAGRKS